MEYKNKNKSLNNDLNKGDLEEKKINIKKDDLKKKKSTKSNATTKQTSEKVTTKSIKESGSKKLIKFTPKAAESKLIDLENELKKDLSLENEVKEIVPIKINKILKPTEVPKVPEIEVKNENNLIQDQISYPSLDSEKVEPKEISIKEVVQPKSSRRLKRKKSLSILITTIIFIIILSLSFIVYKKYDSYSKEQKQKQIIENNNQKIAEIKSHYNNYVKTNKEAIIYFLKNEHYQEYGKINKDVELSIMEIKTDEFTATNEYFRILGLDAYIKYVDVEKIESLTPIDTHYKKYVVFNTNIITNNPTNFYSDQGLIYTIEKSLSLPIIIKETDRYYVEYNNQLLYVKKDDIKETVSTSNTNLKTRTNIRTIAYHSIVTSPNDNCQIKEICHPVEQIEAHFKYIAENNYLALTMKDMELFLDKKIQIPTKSILITIDDGYLAQPAIPILEKYKINATLFLITGSYQPKNYQSMYLELHSHSHSLHTPYVCPGGNQGGGILCLSKEKLLADLKKSREALNNSTVFCYPFYDYNDYAISVLKEAGFKMAFIGAAGVNGIATQNVNKYKIPRITILSTTTMEQFKTLLDY